MSTRTTRSTSRAVVEGFVELDGHGFYVIPDVDRMPPFLMSIVSDADHWMFVSSRGGLTAGRRDAATALFPYETDDRLHCAAGVSGPVTAIRLSQGDGRAVWRPWHGGPHASIRRHLFKSVVGNQVLFEEVHPELGLVFRSGWANSDEFGFVRTVSLTNTGTRPVRVEVVDGLLNLLPHGLDPSLYAQMSNLTNAYKRSQVVDPETRLAVYSLEARVVDRPEPAEELSASAAWSVGWDGDVTVDAGAVAELERGSPFVASDLVTGVPGAYLLTGALDLDPDSTRTWRIVADVALDQAHVAGLRRRLRTASDVGAAVIRSVSAGTDALNAIMARSDALQYTGDRVATAHQFANVTYNVMRGGVPLSGYGIDGRRFAEFVAARNREVGDRHRPWLDGLPETLDRAELFARIEQLGAPQLMRLALEYLPFGFSRRHGDPSRPWNTFSIRVRDAAGEPIVRYEGNWRDIFQNWEALGLSFPEYLPSMISVFLNASTPDGFNPYRITSEGIDWETPDPHDPWSNIGYWGDHQIVYLSRLLEATRRFLPGRLEPLLDRACFSYADVPYRIASYDDLVRQPKATILYDEAEAARTTRRVDRLGADGRLLPGPDGDVHLVTMVEKLFVPILAKLSNYVPDGGIWLNTQRPEWNDANNALVGHGLSMVTLCHLRRHLDLVRDLVRGADVGGLEMSVEVADWLAAVTAVLADSVDEAEQGLDDPRRRAVLDGLGRAFSDYRARVYGSGFSGVARIELGSLGELCDAALRHLDATIRRARRDDGLYQSYNLVHFADDGSAASIEHLDEMLEGQVAVLSSGVLDPHERAEIVDALFASALYRVDQGSFMLYPFRRLPSFLDKNVVPSEQVARNPLLRSLVEAGDSSVVLVDPDGIHRFHPALSNVDALEGVLDRLGREDRWRDLAEAHRAATLETYEHVFRHHAFTGRSGSMYGYEGLGSIYWHMVAKLLVAVQESAVEAVGAGAPPSTVDRLVDAYWRIRGGFGFNKTAAEFGAVPIDPYSHTPAHAGAQQPGMTGLVKEELLTRPLEVGVRVERGEIVFDALFLRPDELLEREETWLLYDLALEPLAIELAEGSLGMTLCQVPIVVSVASGDAAVEVAFSDGTTRRFPGLRVDRATSAEVFSRSGEVAGIRAFVPDRAVRPTIAAATGPG